jgi:phage gpG-like protein
MNLTTRTFSSLAQFSRFLDDRVAMIVPSGKLAIGAAADILLRRTKAEFGDRALADLADATQKDRVAKGFSPDEPLLRDGSLLRDSVESEVGEDFAAVGTAEKVMYYHEFGYINARTGNAVPARPVFRIALDESAAPIQKITEALVGEQLGFGMRGVVSSLEDRSATYSADIFENP